MPFENIGERAAFARKLDLALELPDGRTVAQHPNYTGKHVSGGRAGSGLWVGQESPHGLDFELCVIEGSFRSRSVFSSWGMPKV